MVTFVPSTLVQCERMAKRQDNSMYTLNLGMVSVNTTSSTFYSLVKQNKKQRRNNKNEENHI